MRSALAALASGRYSSEPTDPYFKNTVLLLNGEGNNGGQNNIFVDSSSAATSTITPSAVASSYAVYLDGSGDYLTVPANTAFAFGTGDFTVELWVNFAPGSSGARITNRLSGGPATGTWALNLASTEISFTEVIDGEPGPKANTNMPNMTNTWTHVVACRSSGVLRLFANGVKLAEAANTTNFSNSSYQLAIGTAYETQIRGFVSNLRIVKGSALYTENFIPPSSPLTAVTNTVLLTCQNATLIDNSPNNFTVSAVGNASVRGNLGSMSGTQYCYYFDGVGDYLSIPSMDGRLTGDFTIEGWVLLTGVSQSFAVSVGNESSSRYVFYATANGVLGYDLYGVGSTSLGGLFPAAGWNHFAFVRSGTTLSAYINGVSTGTTATRTGTLGNANGVYIWGSSAGSNTTSGYLSNFRYVNGTALYTSNFTPPSPALTAVPNTQLLTAKSSSIIDESVNAYNIETGGNPVVDQVSDLEVAIGRVTTASQGTINPFNGPWSYYFNGSGAALEFVASPKFNLSGNTWTIECWLYPEVLPDSGNWCRFFHFGTNGSLASLQWNFGPDASMLVALERSDIIPIYCPAGTVELHKWQHFAVVLNNGIGRVYKNGVLVSNEPVMSLPSNTDMTLRIGYDTVGTVNFNYQGYMADARISKGIARYTGTFTPPSAPLTPDAYTDLLTCNTKLTLDFSNSPISITTVGNVSASKFTPYSTNSNILEETIGNSVFFNGSSSFLQVASDLALNTGDFTIEGWFRVRSLSTTSGIFFYGDTASDSNRIQIIVGTDGSVGIHMQDTGAGTGAYAPAGSVAIDRWYHFAAVKNGTNVSFYLDGVVKSSMTSITVASRSNSYIGLCRSGGAVRYANGLISNIRITNSAVYTSDFTVPASKLSAIASTRLLACQSDTIIDNSTNNYTILYSGAIAITERSPFSYISLKNIPKVTNVGSGLFNGTSDYLMVPSVGSNLTLNGDFTIEFWCLTRSQSLSYSTILANGNGVFNTNAVFFMNYGTGVSGNARKMAFGTSNVNPIITSSTLLNVNQWYHVALTRSGSTLKMYVNGSHESTATNSETYYLAQDNLQIGRNRWDGANGYWNGYISNLRIIKGSAVYNGPFLAPSQPVANTQNTSLLLNFDNAAVRDLSGKRVLTTYGNARIVTNTKKYGNGAMYFDGSGDYFQVDDSDLFNFGSGDFTIEAWIRPTSLPTAGFYPCIIGQRNSVSVNHSFTFSLWPGGLPTMEFNSSGSNSSGSYAAASGTAVTPNVWTHVAATRKNGVLRIFQDGILTATNNNANFSIFNSTASIKIGAFDSGPWSGSYFSGFMDDIRVTRGVARYETNFTPTPLLTK